MVLHMYRKIIAVVTCALLLWGTFGLGEVAFADESGEKAAAEAVEPADQEVQTDGDEPQEETPVTAEESEETGGPGDTGETGDVSAPSSEANKEGQAEGETTEIEKIDEIQVDLTIYGGQPEEIDKLWLEEKAFKADGGTTVAELMVQVLEKEDYHIEYDSNGEIYSIKKPQNGDDPEVTLKAAEDKASRWEIALNGKIQERKAQDISLKDGDKVEVFFEKNQTEAMVARSLSKTKTENSITPAGAYNVTGPYLSDMMDKYGANANEMEFTIIGLARAGNLSEKEKTAYLNSLKSYLDRGGLKKEGRDSTFYSKVILTLTALGEDPSNFYGYNLLEVISDMDYIEKQGMNGPVWALTAYNSGNYSIPDGQNENNTTREKLIDRILSIQLEDGGWSFSYKVTRVSDIDMTCMTLQALAPYYGKDERVTEAVDRALAMLSTSLKKGNTLSEKSNVSSESLSQVIVALTALGIDPKKDERFTKNGFSVVDALSLYAVAGGGFKHIRSGKVNGLASYQGYYALVAYYRFESGLTSLYDMTDGQTEPLLVPDDGSGKIKEDEKPQNDEEGKDKEEKEKEQDKDKKPEGATRGITRSAGLIKIDGKVSEEASKLIEEIEKVVKMDLPEDPEDYTEEQIEAVNRAYEKYLNLSPAEKLAVEKEKIWKSFVKITEGLGEVYHYDEESNISFRDNDEIALPWYVKLKIEPKDFTKRQKEKIVSIIGEGGRILFSYDIMFVNTLDGSSWKPAKVLNVKFGILEEGTLNNPSVIHIGKNGRVEFISCEKAEDGKSISFKAAEFSLYGLADSAAQIKSLTGVEKVNVLPWIVGAAAALIGVAILLIIRRKASQER